MIVRYEDEQAQQRYARLLEILLKADLQRLEEIIGKKREEEQRLDAQIEEGHSKRFRRIAGSTNKKYNLTQTARILRVHRQTIYYWINKKWVRPHRDYKGYPVFTVLDIEDLIKWRNSLK